MIIGIAGGSGSGKSKLASSIVSKYGNDAVTLFHLDYYYKDFSTIPEEMRDNINFDHPDSIDFDLLISHLVALRSGKQVHVPVYDFKSHLRAPETIPTFPSQVIILDGILALWHSLVRELSDIKIFVDTDADIRFIRRLQRDIEDRGRTVESVVEQYLTTVRQAHAEFVEPTKHYADLIIPKGGNNMAALDMIRSRIDAYLNSSINLGNI